MINKLKIGFLIAVLSLALGASSANAAALTFSADTTVTVNGGNFTIASGSGATSVVINAGTMQVVTDGVTPFTLISPNRYILSPDQSQVELCTSVQNSVVISAALTVLFSPSLTPCAFQGGSGPLLSGGGGGSPSDTTPPTNTSISVNSGSSTTSSLSANLVLAATDATQMMVSNDPNFTGATWETYMTSKSWTLVPGDGMKTVYVKFKDAAGNASSTVSASITLSGSGTTAPATLTITPVTTMTIAGCNGASGFSIVTGQSCASNVTTTTLTSTPNVVIPGCGSGTSGFSTATGQSCANNNVSVSGVTIAGCGSATTGFSTVSGQSCVGNTSSGVTWYDFGTVTLKNGSTGAAVMELQRFLNRMLGLGLVVDGKLGPKTIAVIKKWQMDNGLVADGLVGAKTKAKMNAMVQ